jgi:hypothetical protein
MTKTHLSWFRNIAALLPPIPTHDGWKDHIPQSSQGKGNSASVLRF